MLKQQGIELDKILCNSDMYWQPELSEYTARAVREVAQILSTEPTQAQVEKAKHAILGYLVRNQFMLLKSNNMSAIRVKDHFYTKNSEKYPLIIFRSAVMTDAPQPDSCYQSLLTHGNVGHVINFYGGTFPFYDFIEQEKAVAASYGVDYHNEAETNRRWRGLIEKEADFQVNKDQAMATVAEIINTQVLRPQGKPPAGNILMHCGGGMHRTGMIIGIIQRCVNQDSAKIIEQDYKRHTGYISDESPAGFEPLNIRFIQEFDCSLIKSHVREDSP
jgi:hypothetical protein